MQVAPSPHNATELSAAFLQTGITVGVLGGILSASGKGGGPGFMIVAALFVSALLASDTKGQS